MIHVCARHILTCRHRNYGNNRHLSTAGGRNRWALCSSFSRSAAKLQSKSFSCMAYNSVSCYIKSPGVKHDIVVKTYRTTVQPR